MGQLLSRIRMGIRDWLGTAPVECREEKALSPFTALQQAMAVLALIASGPLLKSLTDWPPATLSLIRFFFLGFIILLANHVVVAKQPPPMAEGSAAPIPAEAARRIYRYSEVDRFTSKLLVPLALVLTLALAWPSPKDCFLTAKIHTSANQGTAMGNWRYVEISGGGQTTQFPFNEEGFSALAVTSKQKKKWTLTLVDYEGLPRKLIAMEGCLHGERTVTLDGQTHLTLQSR